MDGYVLSNQSVKKSCCEGATRTETGYKNMMDMIAPYKKREYCHLMQIAYNALLRDNKDLNISCPVLITHGEYDKTRKVRYYCKMWYEQINYPLQIIKNAGHNANVDNPEETNYIIDKYLDENGI